jgi:RecB family endonuclease NucS
MDLFSIKNGEKLESIKNKPFRYEKDIQNIVEKNLTQVFDLQFVRSELTIKNRRIDTLSYDKSNKSFVIREGKVIPL